jgi:hypothetical protein
MTGSQRELSMRARSRSLAILAALLPVVCIGLVFAGVLDLGFVWDDDSLSVLYVYDDCRPEALLLSSANGFEYLPVRDLSLCLDHALWDRSPGGYHAQNLAWFMLCCLLVGSLYRTLFAASDNTAIRERGAMLALASTLVFALHPLQVEPVAFITARNALLGLFFLLATLTCYAQFIRTRSVAFYALSVLCTVLALFSKVTALPTALLVVLLHAYLKREDKPLTVLRHATPHLAVTVLAVGLDLVVAGSHGAMSGTASLAELISRAPRAAFIPGFYFYKFVWPASQSVEYVMTGVRENLLAFGLAAVVFFAAAGWVVLRGIRSRSLTSYLCLAFLCALVPVLNLLPTYPPVADRYAQIPLVFLTPLLVVPALIALPARAAGAAAVLLAGVLGVLSYRQVPVWATNETLFAHAVATDARAIVSLENLAYTRWWRGAEEEALEAFERIEQQRPADGQYPLFRAWHAVHLGDYATAQRQLAVARARKATPYVAHMISGEMYANQAKRRLAIRAYERAQLDASKRILRDVRARGSLVLIERALRKLRTPPSLRARD